MELRGPWLAVEADDEVRRSGIGLDTDDGDWSPVTVPGHWRNDSAFVTSDGPLMYRCRFEGPPPGEGVRRWVTLDGVFYQTDVWLDGAYLGDPEGYFVSHSFDVTALSMFGHEHVLAVEVACAPQRGFSGRRNITGAFQPPTGAGSTSNPGGLWRPVHVYDTGPVRVDRFRVLCRDADDRRAHLRITARLDSVAERPATIRTTVDGVVVHEVVRQVAAGTNELEWSLDIADPQLWWPRALGAQPLVDVGVEVEADGAVSDRRRRRTGLRQVSWDDWQCSVNGERLFVKGANLLPTTALPGEASVERQRADVAAAADLGLDALRVHGHIAGRDVYAAADELGVLILQDFPLQWGYARAVRAQAVAQARAAVDALGHHPSIVMWNAHGDPGIPAAPVTGWADRARSVAKQQLPTWNRSVLDRWVKRAFENADSTREVIAHSGVVPHLPQLDGTDSHLWFGWRRGEAEDLATFAARLPRMVRFVSEFGSDSAPLSAEFVDAELRAHDWPDLDWARLAGEFGYQRDVFERLFPPADARSYREWAETTQYYQCHVLKVQIEALRRLKYRPTGGFCFSSLNDAAPAISSSIFDVDRVAKAAVDVVRAACAPVLVVADPPPDVVTAGDRFGLDVHLVSDLRAPIDFAVVDVVARWEGGDRRWRFGGELPADDVVKVGRVELVVPDATGALTIDLTMTAGGLTAANHYATIVA